MRPDLVIKKVNMPQMPSFYIPPLGLPLYWDDEPSGLLSLAVVAYFVQDADKTKPEPTAEQLELVINYIRYYIKAPCWEGAEAFSEELKNLRTQAEGLKTVDDVRKFIHDSMEIGLDPF